jgi:hypothetical protein
MNYFDNKVTLHKSIKPSFLSLLVLDKLNLFIYKGVLILYTNQWRRIVLINEWDWQHSLVLFEVKTSI